jgi:uncharacterized protein YbjT (DUF2867 family)
MFVVAGVTGNTGSVVADALLRAGERVRVLVRGEAKAAPWRARGAEVASGALDDAGALGAALKGARGAYLLVPPDQAADDFLASRRPVVEALAGAVAASGVGHVVLLSSVGAQHAEGTGPIRALYAAEQRLGALATPVTFLRAAYFLENLAPVVGPVKADGVLPSFTRPEGRFAAVATRDIGETAAELLRAGPAGAGRVVELGGPRDITMGEAAAAFGRRLGREVRVAAVPPAAAASTLEQFGIKPGLAALYAEMYRGIDDGRVAFEGEPRRGRVGLDEFIAGLLGGAA